MTTALSFSLSNNQDWEHEFQLLDDNDDPIAMANSTIHMQVRESATSVNVVLEASVLNGLLSVTDADQSKILLSVRAKRMRVIPHGTYEYDLLVERPTGRVYRPFAGSLTLSHGVTELIVTPPVT